ncbi:MAG: HyaD/HybD family hydrogenase maturation endopeptidase [Desulfuromonadia bacterium]
MIGTLVLGIGNTIMSDDGIGVRVVRELATRFRFPPSVSILDGGTLGLDLLPHLEGIANLLIIDAVMTPDPPGTLIRLEGEEIPRVFATKLSPHQMGLQDLLAVSTLMGHTPASMVLLGAVPVELGMGTELSPPLQQSVEPLVAMALHELERFGVTPI